jgi:predicted HicB family RNase H-like nuclease
MAIIEKSAETLASPLAEKHYTGEYRVRIPAEVQRSLVIQAAEQGVKSQQTGKRKTGG